VDALKDKEDMYATWLGVMVSSRWTTSDDRGILFWLRGSLKDLLTISPEIALFKHNDNNQKSCNKAYFLKLPVNYYS
jgi:hypothetical protein